MRHAHDSAPAVYRVLIVDDERMAREGLRAMLGAHRELTVVGESGGGRQALAAIQALSPDILFLDVRMPDGDGFDILSAIDSRHGPAVVFVTAHRDHAVEAFGYAALDYLLKPFTPDRLAVTIGRVVNHLSTGERPSGRPVGRLVVRDGERLRFVEPDSVHWFEGFGNYVRVAIDGRYLLFRGTLARLETRLDSAAFVRISRSVIVNLERVRTVQRLANGQFALHMVSGAIVHSSRRHRRAVAAALKTDASSRAPSGLSLSVR
jgi:two-component system, LytTR family, response regulator